MTQKVNIIISGDDKQLRSSLSDAQKSLSKFSSSADKSLTKIVAISATLGTIIGNTLTRAFSSLSSSLDGAVSRLDTLNNFPRVMSNLAISSERSQKTIDLLSEKLLGLPTTLDDASLAVQRFTAANGNIEASTAIYLALNDALLAGGTSAQAQAMAMEQLAQAYGKGKPDAMEWRKLLETMPAQLKQVATSLGYNSTAIGGDLQTALNTGKLTMNEFMAEFVKLDKKGVAGFQSFRDQAFNSTAGVQTAIINLRNAFVRLFADVGNAIGQANIAGFINGIKDAVVRATQWIVAFTKICVQAFTYVRALFGILGAGKKQVQGVADATASASAGVAGIADGADDASKKLNGASKSAKKLAQQLAGFDEMNVLKEPQDSSGSSSGAGGGGVNMEDVSMIDTSVFDDLQGKLDETIEKMMADLEWLRPIITSVMETAVRAVEHVKEALAQVDWHTFAEIAGNVIRFVIGLIEGMITTWIQFYNKIAPLLKKITGWLADHAVKIGKIVAVIGLVTKAFKTLKPVITGVHTAMELFGKGKRYIAEVVESMGGIEGITYKVKDVFATLGTALAHPFESLQGLALRAKEGISALWALCKAHPFIAIATAVAALALTNEDFRKALGNLLEAVLKPLMNLLSQLGSTLGTLFSTLGSILSTVLEPIIGVINIIAEILAIVVEVLADFISLGLELMLQPLIAILQLVQPILEGIVAVINVLLAPLKWLVGLIGGLFGITSDTNDETKDYNKTLSEQQKQFDKNGDGVLDYSENLSYLRSVIDGTNKAEADLIHAQKEQIKKYQELDQYCQKYNKTADELIELHRKGQLGSIASGDALDELTLAVIDVESANYKVISATEKFNNEQGELQSAANQTKEKLDEAGKQLLKLGEQGIDSGAKWEELTGKIKGYSEQIKETGKNVGEIRNWEGEARSAAEQVLKRTLEQVNLFEPQFRQSGRNLGRGLANGGLDESQLLYNTGWNNANSYLNGVKKRANEHSPSKEAEKLGVFLSEGLIIGIEKLNNKVEKAGLQSGAVALQGMEDSLQSIDDLELNVVAKVDDEAIYGFSKVVDNISKDANIKIADDEVAFGEQAPNQVIVKIGEETLIDRIIDGINAQTSLRNRSVINV